MCPSSATSTAFYTMVAGTKAKASEANNNWSAFRGHIIPINPDTVTSSDNTHDLGATDHRWRRIYLGEPPYVNGSQLGKLEIESVYDGSVCTDLIGPHVDTGLVGFSPSIDSDIRFQFVVPTEYKPGNRIALTLRGYSETTGSAVFHSISRLYRMSITSGGSAPSAVLTGTVTIPNSTAAIYFEDSTLKLTDASGLINGTTVTVGSVISVQLKRASSNISDTNTGYIFISNLVVDMNN